MNKNKVIYWAATGLLSAQMTMASLMYIFKTDMVSSEFLSLGFPTYLIYYMAFAKLSGVVAILSKKSNTLKEWAYAGFFFNFFLAALAHLMAGDGEYFIAGISMILLGVSYYMDRKLFTRSR